MTRIFGACAIVRNASGQYLTVTRGGDPENLALPGGKVEPDEQPSAAVVRELHEETGLFSNRVTLAFEGDDGAGNLAQAFHVEAEPGAFRPESGLSVQWVSRERLLDPRNTFAAYYWAMFEAIDKAVPRHGDWIVVYSGRRFYPLDPRAEDIDIRDIAHALSMVCRFTGHVSRFYSVAEHSIHVAHHVEAETGDRALALCGLLHDASEAYLCDVSRPIKMMTEMAAYREAEARVEAVIAAKFGLPHPLPAIVKHHDERALMTERRDLVPGASLAGWTGNVVEPWPEPLRSDSAPPCEDVRDAFLVYFTRLTGAR